jgi:ABC-type transport system involved in multi-copper enzyme maturation permease subunit
MSGFGQLLRAEWTKLRTVRGWVLALVAAVVLPVLLGQLSTSGSHTSCDSEIDPLACATPTGPDGEAVSDRFYFVHQPLTGDGTLTVRVTSLTSSGPAGAGLERWAKAGLILKDGLDQGSPYAAVMVTGDHGVRMQHEFVHDVAGRSGGVSAGSPRWLRLTREGATVTGYESSDGDEWTVVGEVRLGDLAATVEAGLFVASPDHEEIDKGIGFTSTESGPSQAEATFDRLTFTGSGSGRAGDGDGEGPSGPDAWRGDRIGSAEGPSPTPPGRVEQADGSFTLTGSGDIAPSVGRSAGQSVGDSVATAFVGLLVMVVLATLFITSEHRQGLIRTTLAASPARHRVLAAKAVVVGGVAFLAGLAGASGALWLVAGDTLPASTATEWRVVIGTAALFSVAAVMALAVGSVLRRSAGAITAVVVLLVLPYLLAVSPVVPAEPGRWLLRLTPAAAFAVQQTSLRYAHVAADYTPSGGYYPLAPWAGFAVLCVWAAGALALAAVALQRRDA